MSPSLQALQLPTYRLIFLANLSVNRLHSCIRTCGTGVSRLKGARPEPCARLSNADADVWGLRGEDARPDRQEKKA